MKIKIIKATSKHIKDIGHLFDLYRQFYKYKSNLKASTNYIKQRILNKESTIFSCAFFLTQLLFAKPMSPFWVVAI